MTQTDVIQHYIDHWRENIAIVEAVAKAEHLSMESRKEASLKAAERRTFVSDLERIKRELEG